MSLMIRRHNHVTMQQLGDMRGHNSKPVWWTLSTKISIKIKCQGGHMIQILDITVIKAKLHFILYISQERYKLKRMVGIKWFITRRNGGTSLMCHARHMIHETHAFKNSKDLSLHYRIPLRPTEKLHANHPSFRPRCDVLPTSCLALLADMDMAGRERPKSCRSPLKAAIRQNKQGYNLKTPINKAE